MGNTYSPKEMMAAYGISPKKSLGQNFLNNLSVVREIVSYAEITKEDLVIEVGPGLGVMTGMLAEEAGFVAAIEIDRSLMEPLTALCKIHPNLTVYNEDVMKMNIGERIAELKGAHGLSRVKVVANLPYYITTPIIMMFLEQYAGELSSLTFMIQKEVAERLTAKSGGKDYGSITVAVGYFSEPQICMHVGAHCFIPQPNVDSAVVRLDVRENPPFVLESQDYFLKVVRAAFCQRRKMLANALANAPYLGVTREQVVEALGKMDLDDKVRGEVLTPAQFGQLSNLLYTVSQTTK
jgi:16S rRNA (adenine1518-N6/adenine1519-N6)-dimethyltransferase